MIYTRELIQHWRTSMILKSCLLHIKVMVRIIFLDSFAPRSSRAGSFCLIFYKFDLIYLAFIDNIFIIEQTCFPCFDNPRTLIPNVQKYIANVKQRFTFPLGKLNIAIMHSHRVNRALLYTDASIQWGIVHLTRQTPADGVRFFYPHNHVNAFDFADARWLFHCFRRNKRCQWQKFVARNADRRGKNCLVLWCVRA